MYSITCTNATFFRYIYVLLYYVHICTFQVYFVKAKMIPTCPHPPPNSINDTTVDLTDEPSSPSTVQDNVFRVSNSLGTVRVTEDPELEP